MALYDYIEGYTDGYMQGWTESRLEALGEEMEERFGNDDHTGKDSSRDSDYSHSGIPCARPEILQ